MEKIKKLFLLMAILIPTIAFTACGDDDKEEPNVPDQTLKVGQTYTIPANGSWVSDNDLIASVGNNTVEGVRVGDVAIRSGEKSFNVIVKPTITLFNDPSLQFGESPSSIKRFMNKYGYEIIDESATNILYGSKQNGAVVGYGYTFENSTLKMSMILAPHSIASAERFADYLNQRFVPVTIEDDYIGLISPDKKVLVVSMVKILSGDIMYVIPYAPNTISTDVRSDNYDTIVKEMINATPGELVKDGMK